MRKETKVRATTVAVLLTAFGIAVAQHAGWQLGDVANRSWKPFRTAGPREPRDTIYRMLDAARVGDAEAYLGCYGGLMQRRLQQTRLEMTADGFAQYLIERNQRVKGLAVFEPQAVSEAAVKVRVEFVYEDRNEEQLFYLERLPEGWRITRVEEAQRVETPVPYGTPVY